MTESPGVGQVAARGDPVPGQALVRVEWAGLCGSDLHVPHGGDQVSRWPATPGHEIAGAVGSCPGGELAPGTPVVADSRIALLAAGPDRYRPLITDALLLDEAPARLPELLAAPAAGKVVIRP